MVAVGDTLDGKYHLVQQIGRGGFGRVYLGRELALDRDVAIKVLNPELAEDDPTFLDRFTEEARHVARLDHHNIVPVYVHGTVGDTAYLVMPYIAGGSLRTNLAQAGRLSLGQASTYLAQAAAALDYAHGRNIVHRDVKPENMLVRADGRLLLADFGLAKVVEETHTTASRTVRGTPYYMAPETWRGKAGKSADVYALGCVLFALLTGKPPYGGSMEQLLFAHTQLPVPSLAERLNEAVPPAFQDIIDQALAKEQTDRFPTAGALALAVQRVVDDPLAPYTPTIQRVVDGPLPPYPPTIQGPYGPAYTPPAPTVQDGNVPPPPPHFTTVQSPYGPAHTPQAATVPAYVPQATTIHTYTPSVSNPPGRIGRKAIAAIAAGVVATLLLCVAGVVGVVASRLVGATPTATRVLAVATSSGVPTATQVVASPTPAAAAAAPVVVPPTATAIPPTVAPTATTIPPTVAPTATRPPPTATVPPAPVVRFSGEVLFPQDGRRDLDLLPPSAAQRYEDNDITSASFLKSGTPRVAGGGDGAWAVVPRSRAWHAG